MHALLCTYFFILAFSFVHRSVANEIEAKKKNQKRSCNQSKCFIEKSSRFAQLHIMKYFKLSTHFHFFKNHWIWNQYLNNTFHRANFDELINDNRWNTMGRLPCAVFEFWKFEKKFDLISLKYSLDDQNRNSSLQILNILYNQSVSNLVD